LVDDRPVGVAAGEGAVLRDGLKKLAIYKDENGRVHKMSAVCPHLGCIVDWNTTEKTWDCPCHGSRFDALGKVFQGPANSDLEAAADSCGIS
jgi:Rieske Fe-S protein